MVQFANLQALIDDPLTSTNLTVAEAELVKEAVLAMAALEPLTILLFLDVIDIVELEAAGPDQIRVSIVGITPNNASLDIVQMSGGLLKVSYVETKIDSRSVSTRDAIQTISIPGSISYINP